MLIGHLTQMTGDLPPGPVCFLTLTSYPGAPKSRLSLPDPELRPNIKAWLMPPLKSHGRKHSCPNLQCSTPHLRSIVTIWALYFLLTIQFYIPVPRTWSLTSLYAEGSRKATSSFSCSFFRPIFWYPNQSSLSTHFTDLVPKLKVGDSAASHHCWTHGRVLE